MPASFKRSSGRRVLGSHAFADGLSRLVDLYPAEIVTVSEDDDWTSIGVDFQQAVEALVTADLRHDSSPDEDRDEA